PSKENSTAPASPRNRLGPAAGRQKTSFHQWFGNSPRRAKESDSRHGCRFLTTSDDSSILIGSLSIRRETSSGVVDAQPNFSGPVRGWQDFTAAPSHVAGSVNADLSASIVITYSNGSRASVSFGPASASPQGEFLLVGNSNGSSGPHIIDNISVGPQTLIRTGTFAQIASGAGWKTTITLINSSSATSTARIDFHANDGTPVSLPLSFPQSGSTMTSSFANVTIAPN